MSQEGISRAEVCRKGLNAAVGAICIENECEFIKKSALETLTEIVQSYMTEIARNTRQYCEVGGRSVPTFCDVQAALADCGCRLSELSNYLLHKRRVALSDPVESTPTPSSNVLLVGEKRSFPTCVPDNSNYPKLPDPHTYIRTRTGKDPEDNYGVLRERGSTQRWDVERALTKFMAKTGCNHPLLPDDKTAFPLIAATPPVITYQSALLPHDNNIGEEEQKLDASGREIDGDKNDAERQAEQWNRDADPDVSRSFKPPESIHNPYLRPPKMPKLKKRKR